MTVLCPGGGILHDHFIAAITYHDLIHGVTELLHKDNLSLHIPLFRDFIVLNQTVCWIANYIIF